MCTAAILATGCNVAKSESPLSPSIAGPIPGVNISAPKLVDPAVGSKVSVDQQPLTLTLENSVSNGPRPLTYLFEVAVDADFNNKVFSRDGIAPGDGRTALKLPDKLAPERTYYWRARAQDGANTGEWAAGVNFSVFTPIVIAAPDPREPGPNVHVDSIRPRFIVANAAHQGPVGAITYQIEISDVDSFTNKIWVSTTGEQTAQTQFDLSQDLNYSSTYFWHVRAADPSTVGPWSTTLAFVTPDKPAVAPPPAGGGGSGPGPSGPVPADAVSLAGATIWQSPNPGSWPVTTKLTGLTFKSSGVHVDFDAKGSWPDVVPAGWDGGIAYTLWIGMNIGGQWHFTGPMEYWNGLDAQGGDVTSNSQIARNWTYDCGPMARQPAPGEMVAFFVSAGDARKKDSVIFHARSNIVLVPFPSSAGQSYSVGDLIGGLR